MKFFLNFFILTKKTKKNPIIFSRMTRPEIPKIIHTITSSWCNQSKGPPLIKQNPIAIQTLVVLASDAGRLNVLQPSSNASTTSPVTVREPGLNSVVCCMLIAGGWSGKCFRNTIKSGNRDRDFVHTKSSSKLQRWDRQGLMRLPMWERSWICGGIWLVVSGWE